MLILSVPVPKSIQLAYGVSDASAQYSPAIPTGTCGASRLNQHPGPGAIAQHHYLHLWNDWKT